MTGSEPKFTPQMDLESPVPFVEHETLDGGFTMRFEIPALLCSARTKNEKGKTVADPTRPMIPKLIGYYTKGKVPNFARLKEYNEWKDHVRRHTPNTIKILSAEKPPGKGRRYRVDVYCYFLNGTHGDPENVRKGIVDTLFPSDKWVYGFHMFPLYDAERPRVEVVVSWF